MAAVALDYIEIDANGRAKIIGSRIKVMHLVAAQQGSGYSAEQLVEQYPHLDPASIYAALTYYHAHKAEVDAHITASQQYADESRAKIPNGRSRAEYLRIFKERTGLDEPKPCDPQEDR